MSLRYQGKIIAGTTNPTIVAGDGISVTTEGSTTTISSTITADDIDVSSKANIIWYADRDFEYKDPKFIKADKDTITILAGTAIRLSDGTYFYTDEDRTYSAAECIDTGAISNAEDYYFYMDNNQNLIVGLESSIDNAVQIGGGHTLCVDVGENSPTLLDDSFWTTHPAYGYLAGDFIPNSVWTPCFKSSALTGNQGQAFVDHGTIKIWVDIYLQSGTGTGTASIYNATVTNTRQAILHWADMNQVGKMLSSDTEFGIFSEGSNQCTSISGSALPSDLLCGGYYDTAGDRMISGYFIECCCGYIWQWNRDVSTTGSTGWSDYGVTTRGGTYGTQYVLRSGGTYDSSTHCGSWSRACSASRVSATANSGGRGVSTHIQYPHT